MTILPLELLWPIFHPLDDGALSICCRTCKSWYAVGSPILWGRVNKLELLFEKLVSERVMRSVHQQPFDALTYDLFGLLDLTPELAAQYLDDNEPPPVCALMDISRLLKTITLLCIGNRRSRY
jgi:hypothetical protein